MPNDIARDAPGAGGMGVLPVDLSSPFHQVACVAGATVLGGAFGAVAGGGVASVQGVLLGAAVGFMIGEVICTWEPLDRLFKDALDFESGIREFQGSNEAVSTALDKLAAVPTVKSRDEAALVLRFTLNRILDNREIYWKVANERRRGCITGSELHGVTTLANTAAQILQAQKA